MTEQELTALAKEWSIGHCWSNEEHELALGYIDLLTERDTLDAQIQTVLNQTTMMVEHHRPMREELEALKAERDTLKALLATRAGARRPSGS